MTRLRKHHVPLAGGLLTGLVALGCQAPPAPAPAPAPRTRLTTGALKPAPDTRLAFAFRQPCGEGGYNLAQATPGALDPRIVSVEIKLTLRGGAAPLVVPFTRAQVGDACAFTLELGELPLGTYDVAVEMLDNAGRRVASGSGQVTIASKDERYTVPIECDFRTGRLIVCLGVGCPSAPPPTPSPAPTVPPAPDPAGLFERIHGLHADQAGNVYLFGIRPSPWPDALHIGRTVEVSPAGVMRVLGPKRPTGRLPSTVDYDLVLYEGDMQAHVGNTYEWLFAFMGVKPSRFNQTANYSQMRTDLGVQFLKYKYPRPQGDFLRPWGASASRYAGHAFPTIAVGPADPARAAAYAVASTSGTIYVDRLGLPGNRAQATERPLSMVWDPVLRLPIWSCKRGILAPGATAAAPPVMLANRPAYGLARVADAGRALLFTTYEDGDTRVYHLDPAAGAPPTVAFTFRYGAPHRIERGADGNFYVLLAEPPLPFDAASGDPYMYEFPGKREARVARLRFDPTTRTLVDPQLVVNSFVSPLASW